MVYRLSGKLQLYIKHVYYTFCDLKYLLYCNNSQKLQFIIWWNPCISEFPNFSFFPPIFIGGKMIFPVSKVINVRVHPNLCPLSYNIQLAIKSWQFYLPNVFGIVYFPAISCPLIQFKLSLLLCGLWQSLPSWSCCLGTYHVMKELANYM